MEPPLGVSSNNEPPSDVDNAPVASSSHAAVASGLPRGFGRIVRDADGNVVDVQLAEEDEENTVEPLGRLVEEMPDPSQLLQQSLAGWVGVSNTSSSSRTANSEVVQSKSGYRRQSAFLFHSDHWIADDRDAV